MAHVWLLHVVSCLTWDYMVVDFGYHSMVIWRDNTCLYHILSTWLMIIDHKSHCVHIESTNSFHNIVKYWYWGNRSPMSYESKSIYKELPWRFVSFAFTLMCADSLTLTSTYPINTIITPRHFLTSVSRLCRIHFTAALNDSDLGEQTVACLHS